MTMRLCSFAGMKKREKEGNRLNFPSLGAGDLTAGAPTRDRPISKQATVALHFFFPFSPFSHRIAGEDGRERDNGDTKGGPVSGGRATNVVDPSEVLALFSGKLAPVPGWAALIHRGATQSTASTLLPIKWKHGVSCERAKP